MSDGAPRGPLLSVALLGSALHGLRSGLSGDAQSSPLRYNDDLRRRRRREGYSRLARGIDDRQRG